jgi:mannose-6-phosphate isomerase-like protein (cupin superfamily)
MSAYSLKNIRDADDAAAERGLSPDIESRFLRKHLDSEQLGVSYFRYGPGYRAPFAHSHEVQEEAYVVIGGSGRVKLDDDIVDLKIWDVLRVAPPVVRAFEGGDEGLEMIAIGGTRPPDGDGNMVRDWWVD